MNYKAVMFDLDGTLLNTIEDLTDAMNAMLGKHGFSAHSVDACKYFVGDGVEQFVQRALPAEHRDAATIAAVAKEYKVEYGKRWDAKTRPYDGIVPLLDALAARGLKLTVFSNKPDEFTKLTVQKFLPGVAFDAVAGAKTHVPKKPDPSGALEVALALDIKPAEFLYVGDTNTDMQTARSAGMFAVGATWGFRTPEELLSSGAQVLIDHPMDLLKLL